MGKRCEPFGSWKSPIRAVDVFSSALGLSGISFGSGGELYWIEMRPAEKGRSVLVERDAEGRVRDVTPEAYSVRTRVHEYGGGAYLATPKGIAFSNLSDQRVYWQHGDRVQPLTPELPLRFANYVFDAARDALIAVREDHRGGGEPDNCLVALTLGSVGTQEGRVLARGRDFYSSPRLSPDGSRLAWLCWDHPDMPWDAAELWTAQIGPPGELTDAHRVAGGREESVAQPSWSPDGDLYFVSDRSGWWNIHRLTDGGIEEVTSIEAEFAEPAWVFGAASYAFLPSGDLLASFTRDGRWALAQVDVGSGGIHELALPFTWYSEVRVARGRAIFLAGSPAQAPSLVSLDLESKQIEVLRTSMSVPAAEYLSKPEPLQCRARDGMTIHALYYPPRNPEYEGPPGVLPPLVTMAHGGPTSSTSTVFRPSIQYYTTRGIAVLDVNYRGSTGYGRTYRDALRGEWGRADVEDVCEAALQVARNGLADAGRLVITGRSAGGLTVLAALAFHDVFAAGASHYGIADFESLAAATHKFESRYLDRLVGPYPQAAETYHARSPLWHLERFHSPVLFLHGTEDPVVPLGQAQEIARRLRQQGTPVETLFFEGERHGFRDAENLKRAMESELAFFARVLRFPLAEPIEEGPFDR